MIAIRFTEQIISKRFMISVLINDRVFHPVSLKQSSLVLSQQPTGLILGQYPSVNLYLGLCGSGRDRAVVGLL